MTSTSRKSSKQGSKMDTSMMPPSSVTYVPSTGDSIEDWLISLRQDSPVSPTLTPEGELEKTMTETSGLTHSESSEKSNPDMSSLKTSPAYYPRQELARWNQQDQTWEMPQLGLLGTQQQLSGSFPRSGSAANGKLYPPRTLAHRTSDRGGGVLLGWKETHHVPTPTASDHITRKSTSSETLNYETNKSVSLDRWATHWATPQARDYRSARGNEPRWENPHRSRNLNDQVYSTNWPTPRESENYQGDGAAQAYMEAGFRQPTHRHDKDGKLVSRDRSTFDTTLTTAVQAQQNWPTPASRDYKGAVQDTTTIKNGRFIRTGNDGTEYGATLDGAVRLWPTPRVSDTEGGRAKNVELNNGSFSRKNQDGVRWGVKLRDAAENWPTPSANEDAAGTPEGNMQRMLGNHPDVRSQGGGTLNPSWVGWLMGLPHNWESLDPIVREDFDAWVEYQMTGTWWDEERGLPRVSTGVSDRVNRLKALGNGIVPACVAEFLWRIGEE